jgi:hypothetical protein
LQPGVQTLLIGFGVGLSWAGCSWTETWQPRNAPAAAVRHGGVEQPSPSNLKAHFEPGANGKHAADAVKTAEGT